MASPESAAGTLPVERAELVTQDMEMIAELISQLYVEHRARFSRADPSRVEGSVRSATAGGLSACLMRYGGFGYDAEIDPHTDPHAVVVLQGTVLSPQREESCTFPAAMRSCRLLTYLTSRECMTSGSPWCRSRGRPRAGWPKRLPACLPRTYGSTR